MNRQAKKLAGDQADRALQHVMRSPRAARDRVMVLLSVRAGLRAVEISRVAWRMVTGSDGRVADEMGLEGRATKGGYGGRVIPLSSDLRDALQRLLCETMPASMDQPIVGLARGSVVGFFSDLYRSLGFVGCSSHSGRRTFITNGARNIVACGGSLRDIQQMAGHSSLAMTQTYIDGSEPAKRRVVELA